VKDPSEQKDPIVQLSEMTRGMGIMVILAGLCLGAFAVLMWWNESWASPPVALLCWAGGFVVAGILLLVFDRVMHRFL